MLIIKSCKWEEVKSFWKENVAFDKNVEIQKIDNSSFLISKEVFEFEKNKVLVLYNDNILIGCVKIDLKEFDNLKIAALGDMAIKKEYRKNRLASILMEVSCLYMKLNNFDISMLWATVVKVYSNFGYVQLFPDKNIMVKFFKSLNKPKNYFLEIPKIIGTW